MLIRRYLSLSVQQSIFHADYYQTLSHNSQPFLVSSTIFYESSFSVFINDDNVFNFFYRKFISFIYFQLKCLDR